MEPAQGSGMTDDAPIARFETTDEGVVFLGCFLLEDGREPEIRV